MKKIILGLSLLIAPFAVALVVLECAFPEENFSIHEKKARALAATPGIDTLILGNSHATEGTIPSLIGTQSLNLAHPSQTIPYDLALFREVLKRGKKPSTVVICVSRFNIYHKPIETTAAKWICYRYHRSYKIPYPSKKLALECRSWSAFFCYRRFYGVKDWLTGGNKIPEIDQYGGLAVFDGWDLSFGRLSEEVRAEQADARAANHSSNMSDESLQGNLQALAALIQEARENDVVPVLLTLPVSASYVNSPTAKLFFDKSGSELAAFAHAYGLVWHDLQALRFLDDSKFRNCDHLNQAGAQEVSVVIGNIVKEAKSD